MYNHFPSSRKFLIFLFILVILVFIGFMSFYYSNSIKDSTYQTKSFNFNLSKINWDQYDMIMKKGIGTASIIQKNSVEEIQDENANTSSPDDETNDS